MGTFCIPLATSLWLVNLSLRLAMYPRVKTTSIWGMTCKSHNHIKMQTTGIFCQKVSDFTCLESGYVKSAKVDISKNFVRVNWNNLACILLAWGLRSCSSLHYFSTMYMKFGQVSSDYDSRKETWFYATLIA